ncbi:MAG: energy transducer TonB [Nitrospirota bacterium]
MDNRASRRIKGGQRTARTGAGKGDESASEGLENQGFVAAVALSLFIHALVIGMILYIPAARRRPSTAEIFNVTLAPMPGPQGGGGKSEEVKKVEKAAKKEAEKEQVKLASKPVEKKPEVKKEPEKPEVAKLPPPLPPGPGQGPSGSGSTAKGTVSGPITVEGGIAFPYPQYLAAIQQKVERNWSPPVMGKSALPKAVIYFVIGRDGRITDVKIETTSNIVLYDQKALLAVRKAGPFPSLPPGFPGDSLGVHYSFMLEK